MPPPSTADISASPNPASVGDKIELSGCGYDSDAGVKVVVKREDGSTYAEFWVGMFPTGCMDSNYFLAAEDGNFEVSTYQPRNPNKPWGPVEFKTKTELSVN